MSNSLGGTAVAFFGLMTILPVMGQAVGSRNVPTWEVPFAAAPATMIAAAAEAKTEKDAAVNVLLREAVFDVDEEGKWISRHRLIYHILEESAVESWSSTEWSWSPWYEERPEIRARVCNPDGSVFELDPTLVVENADSGSDRNIYSDRKSLRAPFSGVRKGSVIEEVVVARQHRPFFSGGQLRSWNLQNYSSSLQTRLIVESPKGIPLRFKVYQRPGLKPKEEELGERRRLVFDVGQIEAIDLIEPDLPSDFPRYGVVTFSTAESWQDLAGAYAAIVDQTLADQKFNRKVRKLKAKDARTTALNVLHWINEETRYTGVELGENAIVPYPPKETLKRGFGDCKDQAALMVAMLRQAGFEADIALLKAGTGWDIDPELPGFGAFNHAIVAVHGKETLWFDPTVETSRDGTLPIADQGRWALIANEKTQALVKTPHATAEDNTIVETKEFTLADDGYAALVETTVYRGVPEITYRSNYENLDREAQRENLQEYVEGTYLSGKLAKFDMVDPRDFSQPFALTLEIEECGRAVTEGSEASVAIMQSDLMSWFPYALRSNSEEQRHNPYVLSQPFSVEYRYTIHPPSGFVPGPLPESDRLSLGTASLSRSFETGEDGRVSATLRLSSGKRELTAQEFETIRQAIHRLTEEEPAILIGFEHEGEKRLGEGNYQEAFNIFRSLVEQEPQKTIHHIRFAKALLEAGFGAEARVEARKAVALDPQDAIARDTLGWVLQHDLVGRRFYPGFDLNGAIAAHEEAVRLDPEETTYTLELAILLEHDQGGLRYSREADLKRAAELYRKLSREERKAIPYNRLQALLFSGQFEILQDEAQVLDNELVRKAYGLIDLAMSQGVGTALEEAAKVNPAGDRRQVLATAGELLSWARQYPQATEILRVAAKGSEHAVKLESLADRYANLTPFEELALDPWDPQSVLIHFLVRIVQSDGLDFTTLKTLVEPDTWAQWSQEAESNSFAELYKQVWQAINESSIPPEFFLDVMISSLRVRKEGSKETGFRTLFTNLSKSTPEYMFLAPRPAGLRIVSDGANNVALGRQLLEFAENGQLEAAEQWATWIDDLIPGERDVAVNPILANPIEVFVSQEPGVEEFRLAGACLIAMESYSQEALAILERALIKYPEGPKRDTLDSYRLLNLSHPSDQEIPAPMIALADQLKVKYPDSKTMSVLYPRLMSRAGHWDKSEKMLKRKLLEDPDLQLAHDFMLQTFAIKDDFQGMDDYFAGLEEAGLTDESHYNAVAWSYLFRAEIPEKALVVGRKAVNASNGERWEILHTMAALYAEVGRCEEARQILNKTMENSPTMLPTSPDWLVIGRIAEHYGLRNAAIEAYHKVSPPKNSIELPISSYRLAKRNLKRLGVVAD